MIELNIPGRGRVQLEHLVFDVNGTLAIDGVLREGITLSIARLRDRLTIHLLTADTFGTQSKIDQQLNLRAVRVLAGQEAEQKAAFVRELGADKVIAVGQGSNDALMLIEAALGICILSREGLSVKALMASDILMPDIYAALELLEKPLRIVATLRQ